VEEIYKNITANIKIQRFKKDITQEQIAEKLGVSKVTYNTWENNPNDISKLYKIAQVLNCTLEDFFNGIDINK